jgi:hypothetical protein
MRSRKPKECYSVIAQEYTMDEGQTLFIKVLSTLTLLFMTLTALLFMTLTLLVISSAHPTKTERRRGG